VFVGQARWKDLTEKKKMIARMEIKKKTKNFCCHRGVAQQTRRMEYQAFVFKDSYGREAKAIQEEVTFKYADETILMQSVSIDGQRFFQLHCLLEFLDVDYATRKKATYRQYRGRRKLVWLDESPTGTKGYYICQSYILKYAELLNSVGQITKARLDALAVCVGGLGGTGTSQRKKDKSGRTAKDRGKKRRRERNAEKPDDESESEEDEESVEELDEFVPCVAADSDEEDEEEEEEENNFMQWCDEAPASFESLFLDTDRQSHRSRKKRKRVLHASHIAVMSGAEMLRMLPPEDTKQRAAILAEMFNHFEVIKQMARNEAGSRMSNFPPVGTQVRVSQRIAALGHDYSDVSDDQRQRIGELAAKLYKEHYEHPPRMVPVWVGEERKMQNFYTEATQEFIDEAIEQIMAEDAEDSSDSEGSQENTPAATSPRRQKGHKRTYSRKKRRGSRASGWRRV